MCDEGLDDNIAKVTCQTLGHKDGIALPNSAFGWNVTPIKIADTTCTGKEESLMECNMTRNVNCSTGIYASAYCSNETIVDTGRAKYLTTVGQNNL